MIIGLKRSAIGVPEDQILGHSTNMWLGTLPQCPLFWFLNLFLQNYSMLGWEDSSVVKNTGCFSRESRI